MDKETIKILVDYLGNNNAKETIIDIKDINQFGALELGQFRYSSLNASAFNDNKDLIKQYYFDYIEQDHIALKDILYLGYTKYLSSINIIGTDPDKDLDKVFTKYQTDSLRSFLFIYFCEHLANQLDAEIIDHYFNNL